VFYCSTVENCANREKAKKALHLLPTEHVFLPHVDELCFSFELSETMRDKVFMNL